MAGRLSGDVLRVGSRGCAQFPSGTLRLQLAAVQVRGWGGEFAGVRGGARPGVFDVWASGSHSMHYGSSFAPEYA